MKVHRKTFALKVHYFLHGAGTAPIVPYIAVIAKEMGMPVDSMGAIILAIPIVSLILRPLTGSLIDRNNKKKQLFQLLIGGTLVFNGLSAVETFIPSESAHPLRVECSTKNTILKLWTQLPVSDVCLRHKFNSIYRNVTVECDFSCNFPKNMSSSFKGKFKGLDVDLKDEDHLRIALYSGGKNHYCSDSLVCTARCLKFKEVDNVFNREITGMRYWLFAFVWIFGSLCFSIVNSMQDTITHAICKTKELTLTLSERKNKQSYGQQRLCCSVGYGIFSLIVGVYLDRYNEFNLLNDFTPFFNLMTVLWILDILVVQFIEMPKEEETFGGQSKEDHQPLREVWNVVQNNDKAFIYFTYMVSIGFCYGALRTQLIFLEDFSNRRDCNAKQSLKTLQGLVLVLNTIGEVPFFLYSQKILNRYGAWPVMNAVLFVFCLRYFFYFTMSSPWSILLVELLHGFCTGLFWPASSTIAANIAPVNSMATMLGVAYAAFDALGLGFGGYLAMILYNKFGGSLVFLFYGLFAFGVLFINGCLQRKSIGKIIRTGYKLGISRR